VSQHFRQIIYRISIFATLVGVFVFVCSHVQAETIELSLQQKELNIAQSHTLLTPQGYKNISDVKNGDQIVGYDFITHAYVTNTVQRLDIVPAEKYGQGPFIYYLFNGQYKFYKNQSVWVKSNGAPSERIIHAFEVQVGDHLFVMPPDLTQAPHEITVQSKEEVITEPGWVDVIISGNHSYILDGVLVHNASRYWVGGGSSNSWNATGNTNWGSASNTQDNASIPGSSDDVFFDGVGTGASTSSVSAMTIRSLNMTGFSNFLVHGAITLSIGDATAGANNNALIFSSTMTYIAVSSLDCGFSFVSTSTTPQNVNFAGKNPFGFVSFNGEGGNWKLTGNLGVTHSLILTKGTLNANGFNVSAETFSSSNSNTRTLTIGSGTWTISGNSTTLYDVSNATNFTLNRGSAINFDPGFSISSGTRTINHGSTAGGTESNAPDINIPIGSDAIAFGSGSSLHNINFTGFSGTFNSPVTVFGDWTSGGGLTTNAGTVTFAGTNQSILGSTVFYNLVKQASSTGTLTFQSGTTQTVTNNLILQGAPNIVLSLRSSTSGSRWNISTSTTPMLSYLDVKDSNNSGTAFTPFASTDSGNNLNWKFAGSRGGSGISFSTPSLVAVSPSVPPLSPPALSRYLGPTDNGSDVKSLQQYLQSLNFFPATVTPNGHYGPITKAAIKAFQKAHGIRQTGNVGPLTKKALEDF